MSSLVLMKLLESAPHRYDAGMRLLSLGRIAAAQQEVADLAVADPGSRVLEIGCGTGALTEKLVAAGAEVEAIDQNPEMLDLARARFAASLGADGAGATVAPLLRESTAAELDALDEAAYDAVAASLSLSEMSVAERAYVLRQAARVLKPGGRFVVVDEVRPAQAWQRLLHTVVRWPMALLTWLLTGTTTNAIADLAGELGEAGLEPYHERYSRLGTMAVVAARRPA